MADKPKPPLNLLEPGALLSGALVRDWSDQGLELPQPGERIGAFRVVREIARGGMGVVFEAERDDGQFEQRVALKWLLIEPDQIHAELFRRERQTLAKLQHPNIAHLIDGGQHHGRPWLAMEYIDGQPLDQHIQANPLSLPDRLRLILAVGDALRYAHARGILHCDIKPSNVLVNRDGQVKLLDFGIASLSKETSGSIAGFTAGYASPEQIRGESPTVASEVFQLARLTLKILAVATSDGLKLEANENATTKSSEHTTREKTISKSEMPTDLKAILTNATNADPAKRYVSMDAMLQDMCAFLSDKPIAIRNHDRAYVMKKFLVRNRLLVATVVVSSVAAIIVAGLSYTRVIKERNRADREARISATVLQFLETDMLANADPAALPGYEMTVRQALDRAAVQVETRFKDQPEERRAIERTLANLYDALGAYEQAEFFAKKIQASPTNFEQDAIDDRLLLASIWIELDRLSEVKSKLGDLAQTHVHARMSMQQRMEWTRLQARLLYHEGDYQGSVSLLKPLVDNRDALPITDRITQQYVQSLRMSGDHQEALAISVPLFETIKKKWGAEHPVTLAHQHDLGMLYRHIGQNKDAISMLEDVLQKRRRVLKSEHPETVRSMNELATAFQDEKLLGRAEPLFREALSLRQKQLGESNVLTRNSMSNLGLLLRLTGKLDEAATIYESVLALEWQEGQTPHPDTLALMHNIASLYREQGRFEDALQMHEQVLQNAKQTPGEQSWQYAMFLVGKAKTVRLMQGIEAADGIMAKAEKIMIDDLGIDHANTQKLQRMREQMQKPN